MSSSRRGIIGLLETILSAQNEGKWDTLESSLVQPNVTINENSQQRDVFITKLRSDTENQSTSSKLDSCVVDVNAQAIAARIIRTQAPSSEEGASTLQPSQHQEIILAWFVDGQLSALKTLQDNDARRAKQHSATATPTHLLESSGSTSLNLEGMYHDYIKSINDKTMKANFQNFCKPSVTHNTLEKTIPEYISLIQESQSAIKDLYFDIQDLIVDGETGRVAARLEFTGTPVKNWAGAKPNGESVRFHEHVMYWLDEGRIHWVWSIVDLDTYRRQLRSGD
ncbi:hypothetical protein FSARC_9454 [Fusarium sarcochroum]|uniref:SnoaL-like polyketide cyclase n=1 Tax=Fusarium sarcochroum TaxID=1208366 RepID=A0A8H4TRC3_9HYPO|nr:hypothetical protein FSARC_9454 [Fusarium sarcochroum]